MEWKEYFTRELLNFLDSARPQYPTKLFEAMQYYLIADGKRIRPSLVFITAETLDIPREKVLPIALAVELIHNYSLIHDDMPCMDNDDFRRGNPSCHKVYGETLALLAGDALLNLAYEVLFDKGSSDPKYILCGKYLSQMAGSRGMIVGQGQEFCNDNVTEGEILDTYSKKTSALIMASVICPSILINGTIDTDLEHFGKTLGLIFQLTDDILDFGEKTGYLYHFGKENTHKLIEQLFEEGNKSLNKFGNKSINLRNVLHTIKNRSI